MRKFILIAALLTLAACAGTDDLGPNKTGKQITVTGYSYDQVWGASRYALMEARGTQKLEVEKNLTLAKEDKAGGTLEASTGMSLWSWGEVVGVFINPPRDAQTYTIDVECRTKLQTAVFANNWEDEVISRIRSNLASKHY